MMGDDGHHLLTILIQTSPIPSHPSTALLEALFRSFDKVKNIRVLAKIYILCDGYDEISAEEEEQGKDGIKRGRVSSDVAQRYREHLKLLRRKLDQPPFAPSQSYSKDSNCDDNCISQVEMIELPQRHGSAPAIKAAFDMGYVTTPFVCVAQHDNFFVSEVPLPSVLQTMMDNDWLKCVHFMSTATIDYVKKTRRRYDMDLEPLVRRNEGMLEYSLIPLVFWFGRTAISRTDYYTDFVLDRPLRLGDHLEELLGVKQLRDMQQRGPANAHPLWGNFVLDQGREVLYHLSGRRARAAKSVIGENKPLSSPIGPDASAHATPSNDTKRDLPAKAPTNDDCGSWTTARSARAVVPGLELIRDGDGGEKEAPKGKFKQRCFRCGEKGHSYKWCPTAQTDLLNVDTIDLA